MTSDEYEKYKKIASKIVEILYKNNLSSIHDIEIIYNIIREYPYCLDTIGHYTYKGQYYNCLEDLPLDALTQIIS